MYARALASVRYVASRLPFRSTVGYILWLLAPRCFVSGGIPPPVLCLSLAACQLLIHLEQFGYALGFRHLCGKTVSSHLGFLFFSRRAGTNYLAYKGTKIFWIIQIIPENNRSNACEIRKIIQISKKLRTFFSWRAFFTIYLHKWKNSRNFASRLEKAERETNLNH